MSYFYKGLSGIQSQPPRSRVHGRSGALGGIQSQPPRSRVHMRNSALGDDTSGTTEWQDNMLATMQDMRDWQKQWVQKDEMQRWIQIGATLCIPLAAAVWRHILKRRSARQATTDEHEFE